LRFKPGDPRVGVEASVTIETRNLARCAVQFEHGIAAGQRMQAVDVLRNHRRDPPLAPPLGQQPVPNVGLAAHELVMRQRLLSPIFLASFRAAAKFVEINLPVGGPDAARRAEIGQAALGAHARPGERDRRSRTIQRSGNLPNLLVPCERLFGHANGFYVSRRSAVDSLLIVSTLSLASVPARRSRQNQFALSTTLRSGWPATKRRMLSSRTARWRSAIRGE